MPKEDKFQRLDLSKFDVRVRSLLRWMRVETVEGLLSLTKAELLTIKNCGAKTTAKILRLQAEYGKDITLQKEQETIDKAVENSRAYMNRLLVVAIAANELLEGAKKDKNNRYYFRVTTKCFNVLRLALEALRKQ